MSHRSIAPTAPTVDAGSDRSRIIAAEVERDRPAIGFGGLIEAKFTLKGQYWPRARWILHRDAVKQII